jgi:hypothetical protein
MTPFGTSVGVGGAATTFVGVCASTAAVAVGRQSWAQKLAFVCSTASQTPSPQRICLGREGAAVGVDAGVSPAPWGPQPETISNSMAVINRYPLRDQSRVRSAASRTRYWLLERRSILPWSAVQDGVGAGPVVCSTEDGDGPSSPLTHQFPQGA